MNYLEEKLAIEEYFNSQITGVPVIFENGAPDWGSDEWIRLTIQHGEAYQASLGDNPRFRIPGVIIAQVFIRKDIGSGRALEIADLIDEAFKNVRIGEIQFRVPQVRRIPSDTEWFQINVTTDFYRGN